MSTLISSQKKIAILGTRGIPARYGGFETFADEIAQRLVQQGIAVTVFCESGEGEQPNEYRGIRLEYVSAPSLGSLTTILFDICCLWRARKDYDVVYMLGYGTSLFCFIPRIFGCKVWINMDGLEWVRTKWSWVARVYLKIMEGIAMWIPNRLIADADAIRTNLMARHRHIPECSVIPYGAEIIKISPSADLLTEWRLEPNGYYLIVCRLEPENHVLEIISGYVSSKSLIPLVVVGDHSTGTTYVKKLQAFADSRIRFIGTVYEKDKIQALRFHCRAYFHGHSVGGTNPSLLEALGCGNIIVAHGNPFNREVAGEAALFFNNAGNIRDIIGKYEREWKDDINRKKIAQSIIENRYTWEKITDEYLKLLKQ